MGEVSRELKWFQLPNSFSTDRSKTVLPCVGSFFFVRWWFHMLRLFCPSSLVLSMTPKGCAS